MRKRKHQEICIRPFPEIEEVTEQQLKVFHEIDEKSQALIKEGVPMKVIDLASGTELAHFNLYNFTIDEHQIESIARAIWPDIQADHQKQVEAENTEKT